MKAVCTLGCGLSAMGSEADLYSIGTALFGIIEGFGSTSVLLFLLNTLVGGKG